MIPTSKSINLSEVAYKRLKNLIVRGDIPQGEAVSIVYLSELLQIGRTPTSIACQRLECDGLMRIIPKQGVLINPLTIEDARNLYESRSAIEVFAARKSFDLLTANDIVILESLINDQVDAGNHNDAYAYMEYDTAMHMHILGKQENVILVDLFNHLSDRIFIFGIRNSFINGRLSTAINEHKQLIQFIKEKDKDSFLESLEQHIMNGFFTLIGGVQFVNSLK